MYDVAIVGAGPAGACAAWDLARHGMQVVLLEKKELPRYKTCGGGLVSRARKLLPIDISSIAEREVNVASMALLKTGLTFRASRSEPMITMTMRAALDHLLIEHAVAAGVNLRTSCQVKGLSRTASGLELATSRGSIAARFVIGADGVHSTVAKAAGWADHRRLAPALEYEIRVPEADFARNMAEARFDFDIPPHGYAWVFPKRRHLSVGIMSVRQRDRELPQSLRDYLTLVGLSQILEEERHGFLIPLAPRSSQLAQDRVLLVGDAAGLADPVTAEGISHAVLSGQMAAASLIQTGLEAGRAEADYNEGLWVTLLPDLRAARLLASIIYGCPRLRACLFRQYGQRLVHAMAEILTGEGTYRDALLDWRNYARLLRPSRSP